jgi:hypothetical protein
MPPAAAGTIEFGIAWLQLDKKSTVVELNLNLYICQAYLIKNQLRYKK